MRKLLALTFALWASVAQAQNVPNHATPIGRGPGVVGWGVAGPCAANQALIWSGTTADPTCGTVPNSLQTQTANTVFAGPASGPAASPTFRALVGGDLPNPSATTLGGIQSFSAVTHQWINAISITGVPSATQPAFADISGTIATGQVSGSYTGITGVGTLTAGTWNASPITGTNIATNTVANSNLAQGGANTVKGNFSGVTANEADNAVPSCPDTGGNHLNYISGTGLSCGTTASGSAMVLLNTLTASNSASLSDTTSLTSTYSSYVLVFQNILPVTTSTSIELQVHSGGSFQLTGYLNASFSWNQVGSGINTPNTFIILSGSGNVANTGQGWSGVLHVYTPSGTTAPKQWTGNMGGPASASVLGGVVISGYWSNGNGAVDGFQVLMSSGNIASGVIKVYGVL